MSPDLTPSELLRYSRHFTLPHVGLEGQKRLKAAKVICVGAGGLGSPVLLYLCAAGVGTIGIIDDDHIEETNLQRQILYSTPEINQPKVAIAQQKLQALNPHVTVNIYKERLSQDNILKILKDYDIVVDASDNFLTRYLVNDACWHLKKPNVYASIFQFEGQCAIFTAPDGPCYRCLYDTPPPPELVPNCAQAGVFGVLPGLLGTIQANEVIKLILGIGKQLIGRLLVVDALSCQFKEYQLQRNPHCRLCADHPQQHDIQENPFYLISQPSGEYCPMTSQQNATVPTIDVFELEQLQKQSADFQLLDVREPYEYAICHLNGRLIHWLNYHNA